MSEEIEDGPPRRYPRDIDTGGLGVLALCPLMVLLAALVVVSLRGAQ
jgi:hypothetical protein